MGGGGDHVDTPPPVVKGFATLAEIRIGVKAFVEKEGEKRKAEILSIQTRKGKPTFYVHYEEFNKRLDEWVQSDRIDLSREVEWPVEKKDDKKKASGAQAKAQKVPGKAEKVIKKQSSKLDPGTPESVSGNATKAQRPSKAGGKENREMADITMEIMDGTPRPDDEDVDMLDVQDVATAAKAAPPEFHTVEEERDRLRVSGSMTQNPTELARVRNLNRIQMGKHEIEPWYFSPYPEEFVDVDMVYICEFCLSYFGEMKQFERHRAKCNLMHPPGNEIYRDDYVSFFEIDGRRQRTWCRNLCLLSKLFLDHKTLFFDVDPFLFYCMCTRDEYGCHLVGYFSKEKDSADGYNVACILTLPQFQRKGYGKLLIAFSYELSKREGKLGSPEKPLSDLGLLGYRAYWQEVIVDILLDGRSDATIEDIASMLSMTQNDVLHTLQYLNMVRMSKNQYVIVLTDAVLKHHEKLQEKYKAKGKREIDPDKLIWKPPVFAASARTWNCCALTVTFRRWYDDDRRKAAPDSEPNPDTPHKRRIKVSEKMMQYKEDIELERHREDEELARAEQSLKGRRKRVRKR